MLRIIALFSLLFLLFLPFSLRGQLGDLSAPCARVLVGIGQDSVEWSATPCANFDAYEVYSRTDTLAPFLLIASITDPAQRSLVSPNSSEGFIQYQIAMICGGAATHTSISVSNQRPITPNLRRVYISPSQQLVVEWESSPSSDVIGYQLYKENPYNSGNFFPYPTLGQLQTGNQFTDATATDLLARFAIVAVSPCNKSLLGEGGVDSTTGPHTSVFLAYDLDTCNQTLHLSWNAYENWQLGVSAYEIWASINQAAPRIIDSTSALLYSYSPVEDGDELQFWVRPIETSRPSNGAPTNRISLRARANRPMGFLHLTGLSVTSSGQIEAEWIWDTSAELVSGSLQRDGEVVIFHSAAAQRLNSALDANASPSTQSHSYQVHTTDRCGFEVQSGIGQTIWLRTTAGENYTNLLQWSPFMLTGAQVLEYQVYKSVGGQAAQRIATVADTTYSDRLDVQQAAQYNACYYVLAVAALSLPSQPSRYLYSRSNEACALQNALMRLPNAFAPSGHNREFRPAFVFPNSIEEYSMQIFDRYGKRLFESRAPLVGWDGKDGNNGETLPQGVYVFRIRLRQPDGTWVEEQGTVMLIR